MALPARAQCTHSGHNLAWRPWGPQVWKLLLTGDSSLEEGGPHTAVRTDEQEPSARRSVGKGESVVSALQEWQRGQGQWLDCRPAVDRPEGLGSGSSQRQQHERRPPGLTWHGARAHWGAGGREPWGWGPCPRGSSPCWGPWSPLAQGGCP